MKLREYREYINSLPKELDDLEVLNESYDMEKGIILKNVESFEVINYKEQEKTFRDSFDGCTYNSVVKTESFNIENNKKGLKISPYKSK